jgi:tetratricopeptide (TPR) repeat protein
MPYQVPKSRLLPPRTAREVERVRLLEVLHQGYAKSPVLVLAAGAGYGKSTLLASWPAVWITLGEDCSDPVVLGWHLVEAYTPRLGQGLEAVAGALERGAWASAGEAFVEALADLPPHLLVLDEAQRAGSREAAALLRTLTPVPGLRIAVLTRRAAPWEVLGRVLGENDLAFDAGEALQLAEAIAPELPAFEVEQAHSLVRGWPLGLRLLLRAMQRGAKPEQAFYDHPDPSGLLAYLVPALPEGVLQLAARASVLGELGPEEAGWVGDRGLLERYAPDLLLENVGGHIRFHPLVRQALMSLLEPGEVRNLLSRAADAVLQRGEDVQAAGYLLEAGRLGHAADLVLSKGEDWLCRGLTYTVLAMLERLPDTMLHARPGLRFLQGEGLRQAGRYTEAEQVYQIALQQGLERALLGLSRLYLDTVEPARAQGYLVAARARYPEEVARLWAENLLNAGRVEEAVALGLDGPRVWLRSGQPERALTELRQIKTATTARAPQNHREGTLLLALLEAVAGDARVAETVAQRGRREGETLGSPFVVALAEARLGHALLAQNRWQEAREAYSRSLSLSRGGPARLKVEPLGGLAALGESKAFGDMVRYARESGDAWVEAFMTLMSAQAHLRRGQPFVLPALAGVDDPFLLALAENAHWQSDTGGLLERYPFLLDATLFAPPAHRSRRLLWEAGKLDLPYHPGVCVEICARGMLRVWVGHHEARFKREKTRVLLALLLIRDWSKEALLETLEVSDGEFRVLWSELLGTLEPGRPSRAPGYFLKPYGLVTVPELWVDLWRTTPEDTLPFEGMDHPELERYRSACRENLLHRLLTANEPASWLRALHLEPTDETIVARLLETSLSKEAWEIYQTAMRDLDLPLGIKAP